MKDEKQDKPKLTEEQYRCLFHIMLKKVGGLGVKKKFLDSYAKMHDVRFIAHYDEKKETWELYAPEAKPTIIVPNKPVKLPESFRRRFKLN